MKVLAAIAAFACLGSAGSPLFGQVQDDAVDALAASLPAILTKVPIGATALVYNDPNQELSERLGAKIGRKIVHESDKLSCDESSVSHSKVCSLKGVASLVNLGSVRVSGDLATVIFDMMLPVSSAEKPIEHAFFRVDLKRTGGTWLVTSINKIGMS